MDLKYKHFNQQAIFNAPLPSVLAAARAVIGRSLTLEDDTPEGFTAHGYSAWHETLATVRVTSVANGTQLMVDLRVTRASVWGYILFDIGIYNSIIDRWFSGIVRQLGEAPDKILVSTTTGGARVQRGCVSGCLVYLVLGVCLALVAIPLDRVLFPQWSAATIGPFASVASVVALIIGVVAFVVVVYPEAPAVKSLRARLPGGRRPGA